MTASTRIEYALRMDVQVRLACLQPLTVWYMKLAVPGTFGSGSVSGSGGVTERSAYLVQAVAEDLVCLITIHAVISILVVGAAVEVAIGDLPEEWSSKFVTHPLPVAAHAPATSNSESSATIRRVAMAT